MALKHWTGTIREPAVVWRCPTCGAENAGPLKDGCTACKAGADAKAAASLQALDEQRGRPTPEQLGAKSLAPVGFLAWWDSQKAEALQLNGYEIAQRAYQAGYAAGQGVAKEPSVEKAMQAVAQSPTFKGMQVAMYDIDTGDYTDADDRTYATVLAALAFYRDNQLAYGALPGQLSAEEVTDLITKLTPQQEESPQ